MVASFESHDPHARRESSSTTWSRANSSSSLRLSHHRKRRWENAKKSLHVRTKKGGRDFFCSFTSHVAGYQFSDALHTHWKRFAFYSLEQTGNYLDYTKKNVYCMCVCEKFDIKLFFSIRVASRHTHRLRTQPSLSSTARLLTCTQSLTMVW